RHRLRGALPRQRDEATDVRLAAATAAWGIEPQHGDEGVGCGYPSSTCPANLCLGDGATDTRVHSCILAPANRRWQAPYGEDLGMPKEPRRGCTLDPARFHGDTSSTLRQESCSLSSRGRSVVRREAIRGR